jgi:hypothetical protein
MAKRTPKPLTGRFREAEVIGGKLVLRGAWTEWERRDVVISIFPEDLAALDAALASFKVGVEGYHTERETRLERVRRIKAERAARRKERAARPKPEMVDGFRVVKVDEE